MPTIEAVPNGEIVTIMVDGEAHHIDLAIFIVVERRKP